VELLSKIKPQAIGLVEAFNFNDNVLRTTIGCHDGKPYEYMYDWAIKENSVN
jgi:acyl-CoA oxidase